MGEVIEKYLGDGSLFGVDIKYVYEKEKLGTAGSVKNAEKYLDDGPFWSWAGTTCSTSTSGNCTIFTIIRGAS